MQRHVFINNLFWYQFKFLVLYWVILKRPAINVKSRGGEVNKTPLSLSSSWKIINGTGERGRKEVLKSVLSGFYCLLFIGFFSGIFYIIVFIFSFSSLSLFFRNVFQLSGASAGTNGNSTGLHGFRYFSDQFYI